MTNPNNTFMYDISSNVFDRDESSYRREHAQVTSEFERIRPMFAQTAGFNNKLFNKVFDHIKSSKGPAEESIPEPESTYNTRMPTYGTAEDGGQNMLKEDSEIRGMTQLERAYRSHTNPDAYNESTIERCRSKPDFKERPLSSQEAKQKIDAYRQIVPNPQITPDSRPQIQIQPIYPPPKMQAAQAPAPHFQASPAHPSQHFQASPAHPSQHFQASPAHPSQHFQASPAHPSQHFQASPAHASQHFQASPAHASQHFQASPVHAPQFNSHLFQANAPQFQAPAQHQFQAPAQHQFQAPAQHQFQAPAQHQFQAPAQHQFQAPAQQFNSHTFQAPAHAHAPPSQYQPPIEYQTDFRVREPPQRQLTPQIIPREQPRRSLPVQNHRRTNTVTSHGPDDYRFYAQAKTEELVDNSVEQDLTDLKKMVKKQELLIKLLLARGST